MIDVCLEIVEYFLMLYIYQNEEKNTKDVVTQIEETEGDVWKRVVNKMRGGTMMI